MSRVVLVSDTHLSARTPEALANWDAVVAHLDRERPDLVVHAGDIAADAPTHPDDLAVARRELTRPNCRLRVVPGNHDIGENAFGSAEATVSRERLDSYRAALGPDRWSVDLPGWRLIGLDALLFGCGLDDEADQWQWLDWALRARPVPRRIGVVLHKPWGPTPLLPTDALPARYLPPAAKDRLAALFRDAPVGLVVSGHVHQFSHHRRDGVDYVWVPSTWATIPDETQVVLGEKTCAVVDLILPEDGTPTVALTHPAALTQNVIGVTIPNPYLDH
jgi:3',5'-cyclic AMP phosphodiesterase CpdA